MQNELRIPDNEVLRIKAFDFNHRQKLVESHVKQKLKEKGFNLKEHIDYHIDPITGDSVYRQPRLES